MRKEIAAAAEASVTTVTEFVVLIFANVDSFGSAAALFGFVASLAHYLLVGAAAAAAVVVDVVAAAAAAVVVFAVAGYVEG